MKFLHNGGKVQLTINYAVLQFLSRFVQLVSFCPELNPRNNIVC